MRDQHRFARRDDSRAIARARRAKQMDNLIIAVALAFIALIFGTLGVILWGWPL